MTRTLAIVAVMVVSLGCSKRPVCDSPFSSLQLSVIPKASTLTAGELTEMELELRNPGDASISACVGHSWGVHVFGIDLENRGTATLGRDPLCEREFTLAAGDSLRWAVEVEVPEAKPGTGSLSGWIEVLDLRDCHGPCGCDSAIVRSKTAPVAISE